MKVKVFFVSQSFIKNQCYLIYHNNAGILIDPAWDCLLISNYLTDNQIVLKAILLTHSHPDHTNLARQFAENLNVPVFMSGIEVDTYKFDCLHLNKTEHLQEIQVGDFKIISILTPGHTAGSVCYLVNEHLFTGDTIFIEGVGICTGEGADVNKMYDAVQFLKQYLPPKTIFWPGHSFGQPPGQTLDFLLLNNIYFQFDNRKHFTAFRMRKNQPDPFDFS